MEGSWLRLWPQVVPAAAEGTRTILTVTIAATAASEIPILTVGIRIRKAMEIHTMRANRTGYERTRIAIAIKAAIPTGMT